MHLRCTIGHNKISQPSLKFQNDQQKKNQWFDKVNSTCMNEAFYRYRDNNDPEGVKEMYKHVKKSPHIERLEELTKTQN